MSLLQKPKGKESRGARARSVARCISSSGSPKNETASSQRRNTTGVRLTRNCIAISVGRAGYGGGWFMARRVHTPFVTTQYHEQRIPIHLRSYSTLPRKRPWCTRGVSLRGLHSRRRLIDLAVRADSFLKIPTRGLEPCVACDTPATPRPVRS